MRISHEAIDQALYVQSHGALRREPVPARGPDSAHGDVTLEVMISRRAVDVEDRRADNYADH